MKGYFAYNKDHKDTHVKKSSTHVYIYGGSDEEQIFLIGTLAKHGNSVIDPYLEKSFCQSQINNFTDITFYFRHCEPRTCCGACNDELTHLYAPLYKR
jgi:hypothetical protein